jgi:glycosyltransferase involved in cell wall biosynthesis
MRFGKVPCSADVAREPCTACRLEATGIPRAVGHLLAGVPRFIAETAAASGVPSIAQRALTASLKDADRREWLQKILASADRLVAPSDWMVEALLRNGAARDKVVLCRQGVGLTHVRRTETPVFKEGALRVGFVGRYDPCKGLHVLIDAVTRLPRKTEIELHVWGVARSSSELTYREEMIARAAHDRRVIFHAEVMEPAGIYPLIHVLAVPSLWLETGPLVVLEAQAAGIPVVGSNIGGIAERVTSGLDGLLVPFGDVRALGKVLAYLAQDRARVGAIRPMGLPRTVVDVARETLQTYESIAAIRAA